MKTEASSFLRHPFPHIPAPPGAEAPRERGVLRFLPPDGSREPRAYLLLSSVTGPLAGATSKNA